MNYLKYIVCLIGSLLSFHFTASAQKQDIVLASGQVVYDFAFTAGGDSVWLAIGQKLELWNIEQQSKIQASETQHKDAIVALDYIQQNKQQWGVTVGKDRQVILWDLLSGKAVFQHQLGSDPIDVRFLRTSRQIAVATSSQGVVILNDRGEVVHELKSTEASVLSLDIHPTLPYLAAATSDGEVQLWNLDQQRLQKSLPTSGTWIRAIGFSKDGTKMMAVNDKGQVFSWKATDKSFGYLLETKRWKSWRWLTCLEIHPINDLFVIGGHSKKVKVYVRSTVFQKKLGAYLNQIKIRPSHNVYVELGVATYGKGFHLLDLRNFESS
jgi:WD40 repeat protein